MTDMRLLALEIAIVAHKNQLDKGGHPYIMHPIQVAHSVTTIREQTVALLHDIIEDTEITLDMLREEGFDDEIIAALDAITYRKGQETRAQYLARVKANKIATNVKLADLYHNSDNSRLAIITQKDINRAEKYQHETAYLLDMSEVKDEDGTFRWVHDGYEIRQTTTNNPDGTHGPAMNYVVIKDNQMLAFKPTIIEALQFIDITNTKLQLNAVYGNPGHKMSAEKVMAMRQKLTAIKANPLVCAQKGESV